MNNDSAVKLKCKIKEIKELKNTRDVMVVVTYSKGREVWHKTWRVQYPDIPISMEWLQAEIARLDPWPAHQDNLADIRTEVGKEFSVSVKPRSEDIAEKQTEALADQPFPVELQQPVATPPGTVIP